MKLHRMDSLKLENTNYIVINKLSNDDIKNKSTNILGYCNFEILLTNMGIYDKYIDLLIGHPDILLSWERKKMMTIIALVDEDQVFCVYNFSCSSTSKELLGIHL